MYIFSAVHKKKQFIRKKLCVFLYLYILMKIVEFLFSKQGVVQRHGARATKKLGAGEGAYLAGFLHVFVYKM